MPRRFDGINTQTKGVSKRDDGIPESSRKEDTDSSSKKTINASGGAISLAEEYGIDLSEAEIETSNRSGRIHQKDVEKYIEDNDLLPVSD